MPSDPAKRALFVFAHQDDEFGVFHELRMLRMRGVEVHVAYLTSGTADGGPSAIRDAESLKVLSKLDIQSECVHFVGRSARLADGVLHDNLSAAYVALDELMQRLGAIDWLYILAWEGGHQDHDAVHLVGVQLAQKHSSMALLQFSLYHGDGLPGPFFKLCKPLAANGVPTSVRISLVHRLRYLMFVFSYPSQWRSWIGLYPFFLLHYLLDGCQHLQRVSPARCLQPPHAGAPLYERRGFARYRELAAKREAFFRPNEK